MAENYVDAEKDYMLGMKYKDIATKYGVSINTVKSWKQRYGWAKNKKSVHTKLKKVCIQNIDNSDGTAETIANEELSIEHQMFCIYYSRSFNATQSYLKVYGCSYEVANVKGPMLTAKPQIKQEIMRLKEIKRQQILAGEEDIVELQMRIAFSDMGNFAKFNGTTLLLADSENTDTQLVKKVSMSRDGVSIVIEDRQKAIDWLTKYFLMHPDDKYKAEFDKKKAELNDNAGEEILQNMKSIVDILQSPVKNRNIAELEGV